MSDDVSQEREIRAARNQAMLRAVNEKISALNDVVRDVTETYTIVCECANDRCTASLEIAPTAYAEVREYPRRFAVLPGHVYPEVERVVDQAGAFVVVEKLGEAGELAEASAALGVVTSAPPG